MEIKKVVSLFIISLIYSFLFGAAPKWLIELDKIYPTDEYLRMIGEAATLKQAENEAVNAVAQNFNTKIKVVNQAVKDYNSIVSEGKSESSKLYSFHQEAIISSEADFLLLKYSEPYYDKKNKKYYIVGYINKKEASNYYNQKIEQLMTQISIICKLAETEHESLYALLNYQKAKKLAKLAYFYIDTACTINPIESEKYKKTNELLSKVYEKEMSTKKRGTFSISCKDRRYISVGTGISSILEQEGFILANKNPTYCISVEIHFQEEIYEAGNFVRPDISIIISNAEGVEIDSYSKVYPRYSHQNIENAYNLALVRIQQDLEENLLSDYRDISL